MLASLTAGGWTFMLLSCGAVIALTAWCYQRILGNPNEPKLPGGLGP